MALFSIRNERDLIVFGAVASETSAGAFAATASAGEGKIYDEFGAAPAGKSKFYFIVKHSDGRLRRSDVIDPDKIISYKTVTAVSPVLPKAVITVAAATAGDLYEIHVRIFNDGSLSVDNTVLLNAFYVADTGDSTTDIATGLAASFNAGQTRMGQTYFTCTSSGADVTLQTIDLPFVVGKKDGRSLDYTVKAQQVNPSTLVLGASQPTIVYTQKTVNPCDPNFLRDLEYQTRGAFGDTLRGLAYPHDFALQTDVSSTAAYNTYSLIEFEFYAGDENNHAVQKSPRHLTVACAAADLATIKAFIDTAIQAIDLTTAADDGDVLTWSDTYGVYEPEA